MGLHKLNLKDLNKWAETILLERRQTKSVGRWDSRSTFLRSDWPRPFARREVGVKMDWVDPKINDPRSRVQGPQSLARNYWGGIQKLYAKTRPPGQGRSQAPRPHISKSRKVSPDLDYSKVVQNKIPKEHVSPPSTPKTEFRPAPSKDASINAGLLKDLLEVIEESPSIDKQTFCRAFKNSASADIDKTYVIFEAYCRLRSLQA
ncbi:hypothetical protein TNCV_1454831 [Trichonephila clavipes]|nr:hypothetical protein TNCV_1454831 [Trichonephila clavipes]